MNSYLIIEDMKLEAMTNFKQTWPSNPNMWSNMTRYKIKLNVAHEQLLILSKLKGEKVISFTNKVRDGRYFIGFLKIESIMGLSDIRSGKIIQIQVSSLEWEEAPKDFVRDLILSEVLD
jgi:hypothetical protein